MSPFCFKWGLNITFVECRISPLLTYIFLLRIEARNPCSTLTVLSGRNSVEEQMSVGLPLAGQELQAECSVTHRIHEEGTRESEQRAVRAGGSLYIASGFNKTKLSTAALLQPLCSLVWCWVLLHRVR